MSGTPYQRLLKNDVTPRVYVVLGTLTILVGWMIGSVLIIGIQQGIRKDPAGTLSWFGLLSTNLTLIILIPLSMLVARLLNRQTPGLLSSVVGAVIGSVWLATQGRDRATPIPFGPYLAIAGWIVFFWGPQIIDAYLRFAGLK